MPLSEGSKHPVNEWGGPRLNLRPSMGRSGSTTRSTNGHGIPYPHYSMGDNWKNCTRKPGLIHTEFAAMAGRKLASTPSFEGLSEKSNPTVGTKIYPLMGLILPWKYG